MGTTPVCEKVSRSSGTTGGLCRTVLPWPGRGSLRLLMPMLSGPVKKPWKSKRHSPSFTEAWPKDGVSPPGRVAAWGAAGSSPREISEASLPLPRSSSARAGPATKHATSAAAVPSRHGLHTILNVFFTILSALIGPGMVSPPHVHVEGEQLIVEPGNPGHAELTMGVGPVEPLRVHHGDVLPAGPVGLEHQPGRHHVEGFL